MHIIQKTAWEVPREHWIAALTARGVTRAPAMALRDLIICAEAHGITLDVEERSALVLALQIPYNDQRTTAELVGLAIDAGATFH